MVSSVYFVNNSEAGLGLYQVINEHIYEYSSGIAKCDENRKSQD